MQAGEISSLTWLSLNSTQPNMTETNWKLSHLVEIMRFVLHPYKLLFMFMEPEAFSSIDKMFFKRGMIFFVTKNICVEQV